MRIFLALFLTTICLFSGCSQKNADNAVNNAEIQFDPNSDQNCFIKSLGGFPSMVSSESGYYFFRNGMPNAYIYYTDKRTMRTVALCNKPNCLHADETNNNKRENCNAYVRGDHTKKIGDLLFFNSNLYFLRVKIETNQPMKYFLMQVSLDGTQKRDVFTFKDYPQYIIIHHGFLYYSTTDNGTVGGKESSTISKSVVYRVPMDDMKETLELVYENSGIYSNIGNLTGYEDNVYFICINYQDAKMQKLNSNLMCYNIDSGNVSIISSNVSRSAICDKKLVYSIDDEHKCICDLDGSNKKTLDGVIGVPYCDDKYILTDTIFMVYSGTKDGQGNSIKRRLYVYDLNGKELQHFDLDKYNGVTIFGSDSNCIFLTTSTLVNEKEIKYETWRIDKLKIAGGLAKMEEYFNYTFETAPND